jgi:two-component system, cell cycle sensor histidine kinase and response regulator CckA
MNHERGGANEVREQGEDHLSDRASLLEVARLQIVRTHLEGFDDLKRGMLAGARISATTLDVARVGVWSLTHDRTTLRRVTLHALRDEDEHAAADLSLPLDTWPAYREAVLSRRVVAATDALTDPRTCELRDVYLVPRGVASMMDAPLFLEGEVWGVVCHEHTGTPRVWTAREIDFAVSVADMLTSMLEQAMRLAVEERLRTAEAEVARLRQAEAVVRTASAIGHDINTLLQAITGNAERAVRETAAGAREEALAAVVNDCRRAGRIVDQLRELERPAELVGVESELGFVVADARPTLVALLGPAHALVVEVAKVAETVEARVPVRRADVERILLNLVVNAKEAMPEGGTVTVRVHQGAAEVSLEVSDLGTGIAPDQAPRVFTPYFTTKSGRNAGLGLFAVETIARATGGFVAIASQPGEGTSVSVTWRTTTNTG